MPDPELRARLTPNYEFGCKRVLISNDFYPALQRPNVEFVTDGIREIREHSIVTQDGTERPVDVLIYATGFRATEPLHDTRIVGRNGVDIHQAWKDRHQRLSGRHRQRISQLLYPAWPQHRAGTQLRGADE